ncbi:MAG: DNA recombination protein RmuC [Bacteroidales bacterium]|nr:DNA recombination protein RmuC [Bacteroidales bacterium]
MIISIIVLSILAAALAVWAISLSKELTAKREECARLEERQRQAAILDEERQRQAAILEQERQRQASIDEEQRQKMERLQEDRFQRLANDIMREHATTLKQESEERLSTLLTPLKDDIAKFKSRVDECYNNEARERFSLSEKITELIKANDTIGKEARELSNALRRDTRQQGAWGELILETILEKVGLKRGVEFTVQDTASQLRNTALDGDEGRLLRPDVIVRYPDEHVMIIDSKVSLTDFIAYSNASTDADRRRYGQQHIESMMRHIRELSTKSYQDYLGTKKADFVMMFIPYEGAYLTAMELDPDFWRKAFDKRVVIVTPTHLLSSLQLVAQLWQHDRQTRNAIEIADAAGKLYDKFYGFVDDIDKIDKAVQSTAKAVCSAMNKLKLGSGNLISRAEKLRVLGAKTTKQLNTTGVELTASDDATSDYNRPRLSVDTDERSRYGS